MSDKKEKQKKEGELAECLHPETHKGPQKREHTNQYGDKDDSTRTQWSSMMSDQKQSKKSGITTKLRIKNRKAGFSPKRQQPSPDRELDENNTPDTHDNEDRPKKSKNDTKKDRELDEPNKNTNS